MTAPDVPDIRDEFERKTLETVQWLLALRQSGQMTASELRIAVQTIFSMISGLASKETMELLELVEVDTTAKTTLRSVLTHDQSPVIYVFTWTVGDDFIHNSQQSLTGTRSMTTSIMKFKSPEEACERYHQIVATLKTKKGLTEIV